MSSIETKKRARLQSNKKTTKKARIESESEPEKSNYYNILEGEEELLKRIHVLDSYKDAIEPTKSVAPKNYDILESALRKLYPDLEETFYPSGKWHERLNDIFTDEIPFTGIELDLVFVRNSLDQSKLDKTFYFNESGRGAKAVHDKKSGPLRVIDTAAQHVDEGPGKGNLPFPSDKMPLKSKEENGKISFDKKFMEDPDQEDKLAK